MHVKIKLGETIVFELLVSNDVDFKRQTRTFDTKSMFDGKDPFSG